MRFLTIIYHDMALAMANPCIKWQLDPLDIMPQYVCMTNQPTASHTSCIAISTHIHSNAENISRDPLNNSRQLNHEVEGTKPREGTSEENMVGWYQRGYEETWSAPRGCTVLREMRKENYGYIRLARLHLEDGRSTDVYLCVDWVTLQLCLFHHMHLSPSSVV